MKSKAVGTLVIACNLALATLTTLFSHASAHDSAEDFATESEIEAGISIDLVSANSLIEYFDLRKHERLDYYLDIYEEGEFLLSDPHKLRLKYKKEKQSGKQYILQISEALTQSTLICKNYRVRLNHKAKYETTLKGQDASKFVNAFENLAQKIASSKEDLSDFSRFTDNIRTLHHPQHSKISQYKTDDNVYVPLKKTRHLKYKRDINTDIGKIKVTVGKSYDSIAGEIVSQRFDLEFSADGLKVTKDALFETICTMLSQSSTPKIVPVTSSSDTSKALMKEYLDH